MSSDDKKAYDVTVIPKPDPPVELAKVASEVASTAAATVPAAAGPSVEAQRLEVALDREERRRDEKEARQDERDDKKEDDERQREVRRDDAAVAADVRSKAASADTDIRAKDQNKMIVTVIGTSVVTIIMGAITTFGTVWLATRSLATNMEEVKSTGEETHVLVNSASLAQDRTIAILFREKAERTKEPSDIRAADEADRVVEEKVAQQEAANKAKANKKGK